MREPRNPFRLRASEHIESDTTFVRLFGPGVLELLPPAQGLSNVRVIRSAPGGGKTSLMRLFTPGSLLTLHAYRTRDDCKELYQRMRDLGAVSEVGPQVLGVMLSCARNYSALADMDLEPGRQMRLLFALLDARIVLATLRGALVLARLRYPDDLDRIHLGGVGDAAPGGLRPPCGGRALYDWARRLEGEICDTIDSFESAGAGASGHEILVSPGLLGPGSLTVGGRPVADKLLVMLDDVEKLTGFQRERLVQTVLSMRSTAGIWLAERMEALGTDEMLASGTTQGRDYQVAVLLEDYWRDKTRLKRFENVVLNIADRRAHAAAGIDVPSFGGALQNSLDGPEWEPTFRAAADSVAARVRQRAKGRALFRDWVAERERTGGAPRELAIAWRTLEILIERETGKTQQSFDFVLNVEDLERKDDSSLRAAAELFLSDEFGVPYYYGPATLAKLASSNIEQFLWLASEQFEEVASASIINRGKLADLTAARQEAILKSAADSLWEQIPRRARHGRRVRDLVEAIGRFARSYTQRPSAPNDPGVNGVALSMSDREKLLDPKYLAKHPRHAQLAELLASALAQNLLDASLDYKVKGNTWMVLNLNRLLCVRYRLPLHYGKFKEKTLAELTRWGEEGFKPPQVEAELV